MDYFSRRLKERADRLSPPVSPKKPIRRAIAPKEVPKVASTSNFHWFVIIFIIFGFYACVKLQPINEEITQKRFEERMEKALK